MPDQHKRILHIAPQNISDVPMALVRAERALGCESRLVTFFPDKRGYPEDYCLNLPFVASAPAKKIKKAFADPARVQLNYEKDATRTNQPVVMPHLRVGGSRSDHTSGAQRAGTLASSATSPPMSEGRLPVWTPHSLVEKWLIRVREKLWSPRIRKMMREVDFWKYDMYQFDAGLDFYRDGRTARKLKALGKKIIVLYTGSDLRTRGVIGPVDQRADARFTVEWDHLDFDPTLQHILFPFEFGKYTYRERLADGAVKIGHAPTNRAAKGSDKILAILGNIAIQKDIKIILIENKPHNEAIALKDKCDIFIDQIGDLGYGINALETLAMGIPTCTCLTPGFLKWYPEHPFCLVTAESLQDRIISLVDSQEMRLDLARKGRSWVEANHDSRQIVRQIHRECL